MSDVVFGIPPEISSIEALSWKINLFFEKVMPKEWAAAFFNFQPFRSRPSVCLVGQEVLQSFWWNCLKIGWWRKLKKDFFEVLQKCWKRPTGIPGTLGQAYGWFLFRLADGFYKIGRENGLGYAGRINPHPQAWFQWTDHGGSDRW